MSTFSESALEKKLSELSSSQQSVQTLSLWIIHHRKHSPLIVKVWHRELKKGDYYNNIYVHFAVAILISKINLLKMDNVDVVKKGY